MYLLLAIFLHRLKEKLKISDDYLYIYIKKKVIAILPSMTKAS